MIILIGSNKGGCGKSTTVINLAVKYAKAGKDVLVLDADRQSTASRWCSDREEYQVQPYIQVLQKYDNLQETLRSIQTKFDIILVDVAGRNSRELITAMLVADILICPLQNSQADLDTLVELRNQYVPASDFNPKISAYIYHTMASSNPKVKDKERQEFMAYISDYPEFKLLKSKNYFRKIYKDAISEGKSVIEMANNEATKEVGELFTEINKILHIK